MAGMRGCITRQSQAMHAARALLFPGSPESGSDAESSVSTEISQGGRERSGSGCHSRELEGPPLHRTDSSPPHGVLGDGRALAGSEDTLYKVKRFR